jgi:hypothetical protein
MTPEDNITAEGLAALDLLRCYPPHREASEAPTVDYTALPPVPLVERPRRFSQSLMARANVCPRSAYLAVKHRGGPGSHAMDRGTLGHLVFERALRDLLRHGERAIGSPGMQRVFRYVDGVLVDELQPEDPEAVARTTADAMAALVDEVLREHPELVVPRHEVDAVREMAFHWAAGYDVDPEHVAGIERLMVVDLDCGVTISGRLDVIALPSPELGQVDDYKTRAAPRSQEEYEQDVQPWIYAVLLLYGVPVDREPCACGGSGEQMEVLTPNLDPRDPAWEGREMPCPCEGRGYLERRDETWDVGRHLRGVNTRELYPHPRLRDDGLMQHRELLLHRTAVADYKADLERDAEMLLRRFETGDFPARSGSWCTTCPARAECPLPEHLRDHAGTVNSLAEAEEAWESAQHDKARVAAIEREVKNFCKAHGLAIVVGDERWEWEPTEGRAVRRNGRSSDWDGLQAAVQEAVDFGTPFEIGEWVKPTAGTTFKRKKVGTGDSR